MRALAAAAALPRPNPVARVAAEAHDVRLQAVRIEEILVRAATSAALGLTAGALRTASGGAGRASRSASLSSTSGRTASSIPASRAASSACS